MAGDGRTIRSQRLGREIGDGSGRGAGVAALI
jgi:hypothetical protein